MEQTCLCTFSPAIVLCSSAFLGLTCPTLFALSLLLPLVLMLLVCVHTYKRHSRTLRKVSSLSRSDFIFIPNPTLYHLEGLSPVIGQTSFFLHFSRVYAVATVHFVAAIMVLGNAKKVSAVEIGYWLTLCYFSKSRHMNMKKIIKNRYLQWEF